jgi:DNA-binding GntR family transcriptional regulator
MGTKIVRRVTRTAEVGMRLRHDILSGALLPGQRLTFPVLAEKYGASIGVIREALAKQMERGLVVSEPHLGFRVTPLDQSGYEQLTEARAELETFVLRRAIADGDLDWESRVVAAHHRLERTPRNAQGTSGTPSEPWLEAHADFHNALLDGCRNRRLLRMAESLRDETELYRRWATPRAGALAPADETAPDEHRALLDAAVSRDADEAVRYLRQLISYSGQLEVGSVPEQPE